MAIKIFQEIGAEYFLSSVKTIDLSIHRNLNKHKKHYPKAYYSPAALLKPTIKRKILKVPKKLKKKIAFLFSKKKKRHIMKESNKGNVHSRFLWKQYRLKPTGATSLKYQNHEVIT